MPLTTRPVQAIISIPEVLLDVARKNECAAMDGHLDDGTPAFMVLAVGPNAAKLRNVIPEAKELQ